MRAVLLTLALGLAPALAAQRAPSDDPRYVTPAPVLELRAVLPLGGDPEFQLGPGLSLRAGWYVRTSFALLAGAVQQDSATLAVGRAEAAMRFHLDPFFQGPGCRGRDAGARCRGVYGGVGLSQRFLGSGGGAENPVLVLLLGVEGARNARGVWATELAVGGGLRLGLTWRGNRADGYR